MAAKRRTMRARVLKWGAIAIGAVAVVYLAGLNGALRSDLVKKGLSSDPTLLIVDYGSAYSLYPGHLHVKALDLRLEDDSIELHLRIEEADVQIALSGFFHKRFHATSVRGRGVSWRMIHKVSKLEGNERRVAAFPPIPNPRGGPPVLTPPPGPPPTEPPHGVWGLKLEDIVVDVDEVWIIEFRWQGHGVAMGTLEFVPGVSFELAPSHGTFDHGQLSVGKDVVSKSFDFQTDWTVKKFIVLENPGPLVLRNITASVQFDAPIDTLGLAALYLPDVPISGSGRLATHAAIADGTWTKDTRFDLQLDRIRLKTDDVAYAGGGKISVRVGEVPAMHFSTGGEARLIGKVPLVAEIHGAHGDGTLTSRDTWKGLTLDHLKFAVAEVKAEDASPVTDAAAKAAPFVAPAILGKGPLVVVGKGRVTAETLRVDIEAATLGAAQMAGTFVLEKKWNGAAAGKIGPLPLGVTVRGGAVKLEPFISDGWLDPELQRIGIGGAAPVR